MGIKSVINTERLYWLGRYIERVYTTVKLFSNSYDSLIESDGGKHTQFCMLLDIPDCYKNGEDFIAKYAFSTEDPNSIHSNLRRAYDNAIELRDEIGSNALSYIQMALYEMAKAGSSEAPMLRVQSMTDDILAFWGCIDDEIDDENTRNIIKIGKRVERLDLVARLHRDSVAVQREIDRLVGRIGRTELLYNHDVIDKLKVLEKTDPLDYNGIVNTVEQIME
jgi:Uncharacterized protein conserved in bacteria